MKPFGGEFYREKVDYIWHTSDGLKSTAHKIEDITLSQGLPSLTQPSDHVAITATFG